VEAEVDQDAEITAENFANEAGENGGKSIGGKSKSVKADWKLEIERVTSLFISKPENDTTNWRAHTERTDYYLGSINENMDTTEKLLLNLDEEVQQTTEKIVSRENYLNSQFSSEVQAAKLTFCVD
jgi:intraflagellar transport protein 57